MKLRLEGDNAAKHEQLVRAEDELKSAQEDLGGRRAEAGAEGEGGGAGSGEVGRDGSSRAGGEGHGGRA